MTLQTGAMSLVSETLQSPDYTVLLLILHWPSFACFLLKKILRRHAWHFKNSAET